MQNKSDNWAGDYPRGPMVHQQRHRPNGFKRQVYPYWNNIKTIDAVKDNILTSTVALLKKLPNSSGSGKL